MRDWDKFMVRLPPGFRERVKELAKENGRSMNAEIVQRLKEALKNEGKLAGCQKEFGQDGSRRQGRGM